MSVAIFLDDHLPSCACIGHTRHSRTSHSSALGHLLVVLRDQGAIAQSPVSMTPVEEELRRYDDHMDHVRGLAPKTRTMMLRIVGRLPVHPSTLEALRQYRLRRDLAGESYSDDTAFFVNSRGRLHGLPLGDRQVHRVFGELRRQLGWPNRGSHHAARIHDLRHTFVVRRIVQWHAQGVDIDQAMLSLSTYIGHPTPRWAATRRQTRSCDSCKRCNYAQTSSALLAHRHKGRRGQCRCTCA